MLHSRTFQVEVFTIDFKRVRNIKTIRTYGDYQMPTVTVWTSNNGNDWTIRSHTTSGSAPEFTHVLDSAADARWLRIRGDSYTLSNYVGLKCLRVYGEAGTMEAGSSLDLVSSSALSGGVTLTKSAGWYGYADANLIPEDNPTTTFSTFLELYEDTSTAGETVTLTWGQTITFGAFGFKHGGSYWDPNMHFKLWGSTNGGATFESTPLLDVTGVPTSPMVDYWDLATPFTGNALKFEIISATPTIVLCDFFAYEAPAPATAGDVTFAIRENVNLMNARDVEIAATYSAVGVPNDLRGYGDTYAGSWASGYIQPNKLTLTMDFKQVRNLKTIRAFSPAGYGMPTVTIETSDNGSSWTTRSHTTTPAGPSPSVTNTFNHVLDSAVDARWLRITGESYQLVNYVGFGSLRVYGDTNSTLAAGTNLDLVCDTALDGGVALGQSGWLGWSDASYIPNDNPAEFKQYQALYDWGGGANPTGNTVTLTWGQTFVFGAFGIRKSTSGGGYFTYDPDMHFKLWGSTDGGANFTNLLLDVDGGLPASPQVQCWDLATPFTGNAMKFEVVASTTGGLMIDDFFAFAAPPPPPPLQWPGILILVQ